MKEAPPKTTLAKNALPKPTRLRRLSEEEIELWTRVAASVTPRSGASLPRLLEPLPAPGAKSAVPSPTFAPPVVRPPRPAPPPFVPLERALKRKLARGMTADAAIDLHGFRQDEAYSVLRHFLMRAQGEGARVVLVVTGKGSRGGDPFAAAGGPGVLRRAVPLWLALPDFRPLVLGFEEAGRPHGGAGALYVRLRRSRP